MRFRYVLPILLFIALGQAGAMSKVGPKNTSTPRQPDSWPRWQFMNVASHYYAGTFREAGTFLDSINAKVAKNANLIQEEVIDSKVLYVGRSKHGLSRAINPRHAAHGARKECGSVRIFICRDPECAKDLEACLIDSWRPTHNRNFIRRPRVITPFVKEGEDA
jgi:hypothetical protein